MNPGLDQIRRSVARGDYERSDVIDTTIDLLMGDLDGSFDEAATRATAHAATGRLRFVPATGPVLGGQGRSAAEVRRAAIGMMLIVCGFCGLGLGWWMVGLLWRMFR